MKDLLKILKELEFKYIPQDGVDAWSKVYKGFILFIVKLPNEKFIASVTIGQLEISIPSKIDEYWIIEFDKENDGNEYDIKYYLL
jgi:hypothetical protein